MGLDTLIQRIKSAPIIKTASPVLKATGAIVTIAAAMTAYVMGAVYVVSQVTEDSTSSPALYSMAVNYYDTDGDQLYDRAQGVWHYCSGESCVFDMDYLIDQALTEDQAWTQYLDLVGVAQDDGIERTLNFRTGECAPEGYSGDN